MPSGRDPGSPRRPALLQPFSFSLLPVEAVAALGNKVVESLRAQDPGEGEAAIHGRSRGDSRPLRAEFPLFSQS